MKELIIIGAGLGSGSITLDGLNALRSADAVLYDRLVHEDIIKMIPDTAVKVSVGKDPYSHNCIRQEDINAIIREHIAEGEKVVRLKGGDSTLFARSLEEAEEAHRCGAVTRIIPGVTSASTLASKMTKALTDRRSVSGCVFITGHLKNGECQHNWKALAELGMTIVVYMGVKNGGYIADELMKNGMNAQTPCLVGSCLESEHEKLCVTTLSSLGGVLETGEYPHPATIIIGDSVG
ncbi:MAG: uroporphyrinogen-III C-methyltransferase [Deferribacterales bacterium]